MSEDQTGFLFPEIHQQRCISCGRCKKVCAFQNVQEKNTPQRVYAIAREQGEALKKSASGGIFAAFAENIIRKGGVAFGAALVQKDHTLYPCHVMASTLEELLPLLDSKYVQSDLGTSFVHTQDLLDEGKQVLFSGTPCQIAGLKAYLGKEYDNLLTMDLICHGVPSAKMFQDYIQVLGKRLKGEVIGLRFRDKTNGWGRKTLRVEVQFADRRRRSISIPSYDASYYQYFLTSEIDRKSCYRCPYANQHHPADITIGDFWGIEKVHPNYLRPKGKLDVTSGISVMMLHTTKGVKWFERMKDVFIYYESSFEMASKHNGQLKHPSVPGIHRDEILRLYCKKGFTAVDKQFRYQKQREKLKERIKYHLHKDIPEPVRKFAKGFLISR